MKAQPSGKALSVFQLGRAARVEGKVNWYLTIFFYLGATKGSNWSTQLWTQNLSSRWLSGDQPMHRRSFSTWFGRKEVSSWPQVDKVIISHILRHLPERSWKVSICELCLFNLEIMRKSLLKMFFVIIPQKVPVHSPMYLEYFLDCFGSIWLFSSD